MADYSEHKPRSIEDDLEDLDILESVINGYRALAYNGEVRAPDYAGRSDYALKRLRATFEAMLKYRENSWK